MMTSFECLRSLQDACQLGGGAVLQVDEEIGQVVGVLLFLREDRLQ